MCECVRVCEWECACMYARVADVVGAASCLVSLSSHVLLTCSSRTPRRSLPTAQPVVTHSSHPGPHDSSLQHPCGGGYCQILCKCKTYDKFTVDTEATPGGILCLQLSRMQKSPFPLVFHEEGCHIAEHWYTGTKGFVKCSNARTTVMIFIQFNSIQFNSIWFI